MSGETRRAVHRTIFAPSAFYRRREEHMNNGHDTGTTADFTNSTGLSTGSVFPHAFPGGGSANLDAKTFTDAPRVLNVNPKGKPSSTVKIRCKRLDAADFMATALKQPGVLEVLDIIGRMAALAPAEKRLALMLLGEDL
jgi:hypothetical protein